MWSFQLKKKTNPADPAAPVCPDNGAPTAGSDGRVPVAGSDGRVPTAGSDGRAPTAGSDGHAPTAAPDGANRTGASWERVRDRIRGSLIGGAAGDALGCPVEFISRNRILAVYGEGGIRSYRTDGNGKALISDDTQMTLFTADGLLTARVSGRMPEECLAEAYRDWYRTQTERFSAGGERLLGVPELFARRAPGNTCLSAVSASFAGRAGSTELPINNSKGCGGVMRAAPVGLLAGCEIGEVDRLGAECAALTHGHPLGWLPAAVLAHLVNRLTFSDGETLAGLIGEAKDALCLRWGDLPETGTLCALIDRAVTFAANGRSDAENIEALGEGWVAEETLAVALYCALRYEHDFSGGLIASVNHDGDSDSTGAVTGNLLGAVCGYDAMDEAWKRELELHTLILSAADDLAALASGASGAERLEKYGKTAEK